MTSTTSIASEDIWIFDEHNPIYDPKLHGTYYPSTKLLEFETFSESKLAKAEETIKELKQTIEQITTIFAETIKELEDK